MVGDVIGDIGQELDIEFEHELPNLQNVRQESDEADRHRDDNEILDHAEIELESKPESSGRALRRQTDNIGDSKRRERHVELEQNNYGDEIIEREDSSNFNVEQNEEDVGLG